MKHYAQYSALSIELTNIYEHLDVYYHVLVLTIVMEANPSTVDEDDGSVTVIVRAVGGLQRTINLK